MIEVKDIALLIFLFCLGGLLGTIIGIKLFDYIDYRVRRD
jgi:hypothetical protein